MRSLLRTTAVALCWAAAVTVASLAVANAQSQGREDLETRFAGRATTSAEFVSAYVADIFALEGRLASSLPPRGFSDADLADQTRLAGFTAAVLLDPQGRVVALAPADPALHGVDLAAKYPHLSSALAGEPTVSGVVLSAADQTPIVAFALPLDGGTKGVLSAGFSLEDSPLSTFLSTSPIQGIRGYIVDSTGTPAVFAGEGATATVDGVDVERALGAPVVRSGRLAAAAPIAGTPWRLVLTAPEAAVVKPAAGSNWVAWTIIALAAVATLVGLLVLGSVSRSRRRSREAQAESEQRFRLTVDHAPIGMTMVGLDGRFQEPNNQLCRMLGYEAEHLATLTFQEITHPDDRDTDMDSLQQLLAAKISHYEMEKRYVRGDGSTVWARLSVSLVRGPTGEPLHFVCQVEDVTEVRAAQEKLERRALYDPLTGLANRSLLLDRLSHALEDHRRDGGRVAVAFCDLDHFKRVNDSLGHQAGDVLLKEVARRLQQLVRGSDTVARMGGDEFVLLLPHVTSMDMATTILDRAKQVLEQPIEVEGHLLTVSFSAGLAVGGPGNSAEMLLRDADTALYAAKEGGRSRCEIYTAAMRSHALMHLS
ncbi:MAG: diguanylate cyclase, partial [Propionibacteriales bacterium]|nr:diguanylate cyclase [Propionibacteriales bacterium]